MKHLLLSGLLMAAVGSVSAADFTTTTFTPPAVKNNAPAVSAVTAQVRNSVQFNRPVLRSLPVVERNILNVKPARKPAVYAAEANSDLALFESFEAWPVYNDDYDIDLTWLPENWTAQRLGDVAEMGSWFPFLQYSYYYPTPADGQYYFMIMGTEEERDEWLISPEFEIEDGMELSYYLFYQPFYLFSTDNINWDTYEYEGDKVVTATFQVMIKAEGEQEWTKINDIADKYMDYTGEELIYAQPTGMEKQQVSLADYAGKKVQLAFRYVGTDGDTMWLDAIRVGVTPLENVSYALPAHTFYWGWNTSFTSMNNTVAQVPVFTPITFTNTSEENATYEWKYIDPMTGMDATSDDQINLVLTYKPDYTDEETKANNVYDAPALIASAPGKASGIYAPDMLIQAGGAANLDLSSGTYNFSIFPFLFNDDDISGIALMDSQIGDPSIPIFGHNMHTNEYWFNYTANGDEDANPETCYNRLEGIANLYMPEQGETIVVNGVNVFGYGLIYPGAELKFTIYALPMNEYGISNSYEDLTVVATKTIKGSDILYYYDEPDQKDYICLPFNFDAPAVVTATEEYPAFFFMLEGFNSDEVEYFLPYQTIDESLCSMNLAYMVSHIDFQAVTGRPAYYSVKPLVYIENGDYHDLQTAFAFGLMAEYPWLTCDVENVNIGSDVESVEVALGSYYDGSQLTVEASEGLVAEVAGRYDECVLTIAAKADSDASFDGVVTVKGPGVEVMINVHVDKKSSIKDVIGSDAVATDTYDVYGRRIENASNGIYIVKYNDGTVRKKVVVE
ncbi:MAG: choice-of-anchor J domain-containing protein [Muribaculaceae bacterium]|nr:choice-of-anchor J domain-containing protein [Muribaculaceae bacterium]